ncbi:MAG: MarR family winged helix-turn-helix transcriptional regulator [Sporichthyaceae bacterium]
MKTLGAAELELAHTVRIALMRLVRKMRRQGNEAALSLTQMSALATVDRHGALTPRELAEHEQVQPPSMTKVIAALEERGLVAVGVHPQDGRQKLVSVTAAARDMLEADRRARDEWLAQRMANLTAAEIATLRAALPVVEKLLRADP